MAKHNKQLSNSFSTEEGGRDFENKRFGIIQLSDLQFGQKHRFGYPSTILNKLLDDVKTISGKYKFIPYWVVLSGDISQSAKRTEFQDAINILSKFSDGLNIDKMNILCIPGNHDVSWRLCKTSPKKKFQPYIDFVSKITNNKNVLPKEIYQKIERHLKFDERTSLDIEFLLLNSCEKEKPTYNTGYINPEKLKETLQFKNEDKKLKIAISHHRLDTPIKDKKDAIRNAHEIKPILLYNKYNIVLTGHAHQGDIGTSKDSYSHQIIFAGCGSTGADKTQREDGIQNQYCIHIIDLDKNLFQSMWRAYNPAALNGLGGWMEDNSFNPITEYELPDLVDRKVSQKSKKKPVVKRKRIVASKVKIKFDKKFATELALANLLGRWNEKD